MANPTNKGVGTGSAVVHDYSTLNKAADNAFKNLRADKIAGEKKKDAAAAKKAKGLEELRGDFGDYDTSKMREADKEAAVKMNEDGYKMFDGNWDKVLNGDPYWSNLYREQMNKLKIFISNSVESKGEMKDLYASINEPDSGYSPEKKKQMEEYMLATGSTMKDMKEKGLFAQDTVVGDPLGRMDEAFLANGEELYTTEKGSYVDKKGAVVKYDKQNWKPEAKALPVFKATISANPRIMSDLEIKYPGVEFDEQVQRFYDEYKTSREVVVDERYKGRDLKDDAKANGFGSKTDKYDFAIRTRDVKVRGDKRPDKSGLDVITVAKKSGSALSPITVNGVVGVVSEIKKNKDNEWVVVRNITKDDLQGNMVATGETITDEVDKTMESHLESEYGIKDLDKTAKELKSKNKSDSMSAEDKEAYDWAVANPNHPQSKAILELNK